MSIQTKADYGIDAPGVIRNFAILGLFTIGVGQYLENTHNLSWLPWLGSALTWYGASTIASSVFMVVYAKYGKFRHRDRMLKMIPWKGTETVLDIGTGRGLLMIGAAKKLKTGKSFGIDIWNSEDLSGNFIQNTLRNVDAEGVKDRIEIKNEDVRQMSFPNETFDVILSNLCVHNIYVAEERLKACKEIARVLKPGGVALISDFRHTKQYTEALNEAGLIATRSKPFIFDTFPPLQIVTATKSPPSS